MAVAQQAGALPDDTQIYCGHEYAAANIRFAQTIEPNNTALAARADEVDALHAAGKPTIPATIGAEKAANPFLRADVPEVARSVGHIGARPGKFSRKSANARTASNHDRTKWSRLRKPPMSDEQLPRALRDVIRLLGLKAHPESGYFRETFRDKRLENGRAASTAIYVLLARRSLALAPDRHGRGPAPLRRRTAQT